MLDKTEVLDLARKYAEKVNEIFDTEAIMLYGSFVNGLPHEYSDINIAVVMAEYDGKWLETTDRLYEIGEGVHLYIAPRLFYMSLLQEDVSHSTYGLKDAIMLYHKDRAGAKEVAHP